MQSLAFSHGAGAAINCYFPLYNTQGWDERTEMSSEGLHRSKDPGAGAFTPYHGRVTYATRPIRAGEELFTDYGEAYFTHNPETYGNIPLWDDYEDATEILREFVEVRDEITQSFDKVTKEVFHKELYESVVEIIKVWDSRTLNALPDKPEVVDELAIIGTNYTYWNRSVHSQEYLEENGICMDNMVVRPSELPQAGRGAFARRFIPKDSVVAPAPLIHMDETLTEMYPRDYDPETEKWWADRSEPVLHHQILMNYCFGHNRSTVLLCPYGMFTGLINHSKEKVNAKIVWSKKIMRNPEWLEKPIEEWLEEIHVGLAFDFVALRDIHPGEEIYIDYGDDWENAWREHVNNWKPPKNAESYKASFDLNADPDLVVPTFEEGSFHHDSVEMLCRDYFRTISGFYPDRKSNHYCRVLSRTEKNGEQEYTVEILERSEPEDDDYCYEELDEILFNVPRDVFYFEDIPYTRDTAQPWSFRHRMAIPNEIMPVAWLNKR